MRSGNVVILLFALRSELNVYSVWVYYDLGKYRWGSIDSALEESAKFHGGRQTGGGTGFGQRDQSFDFPNISSADAFECEVYDKFPDVELRFVGKSA